ncbi:MAG: hypothetical protein ACFFAQ_01940 [Promethearchaeota archaeon]
MLEISPISGSVPNDYKLKIVIKFNDGTGEKYYIPTPKEVADIFEDPLYTAYFDLHYYIDISDDKRVPNNYGAMRFDIELWRVDRYWGLIKKWDKKLVSGDEYYYIQTPGHDDTLTVEKYDESELVYQAKVKVKTIGVEKANTIAIYETNGTVFNGHYQEQERMNIIQLYVNDSGVGTPFVEGPNVIVIPTSLFTETIFNAYVQNETLHETPIYSSDDDIFKFISVGRDGSTEQACDEIDFVFIRFDISSQDAMEILNLLLECLVNETTNETAIVYSYVSTKLNGTLAVMMNLPISVLGFVPWFCNFENSIIGSKPETRDDVFWKGIKKLISLAVGLIVIIGMAILELVELIGDFIMEILMEWLPILEFILLLIIGAIILIYIWIMFAFTVLSFMLLFLQISLIFIFFSTVLGTEPIIKLNYLAVENDDLSFNSDYRIGEKYNNFLKLKIPTLFFSLEVNQTSYNTYINFFDSGSIVELDFFETILQKQNVSSKDANEESESWWNGFNLILGSFTLLESSHFITRLFIDNPIYNILVKVAFYLGVFSLTLGIMNVCLDFQDKEKRFDTLRGLIFASIVLFGINFLLRTLYRKGAPGGSGLSNTLRKLFKLGLVVALFGSGVNVLNSIMSFFGIDLGVSNYLSLLTSIPLWLVSLLIISHLPKNKDRKEVINDWLWISIFLIFCVVVYAAIILNLN